MLEVQNLSFDYFDKSVLSKVQFSLDKGQLLHLRGANGAGKTTLLKLLSGLLPPLDGEIRYEGKNINDNLKAYQRKICYLGHKASINPLLTVKENCQFDMHWGRRFLTVDNLLERFDLEELINEPCYLLSAGQKRRVSLLRIAMTDADLWLLDEPLIALDTKSIQTLMFFLENHLSEGGMIILTSHQTIPLAQNYLEYAL